MQEPLDFYAVTDHAILLGMASLWADPTSNVGKHPKAKPYHNLNSPENLNALSENMMDLIQNGLDKAGLDKNVRVIIISGEGSTFSSGHDLKELKAARKGADKGKKYFLKIFEKR